VLPRLSPLYAAVNRLADVEVAERQKAVAELEQLVVEQPLPLPAAREVVRRLIVEADPFIWQQLLAVLQRDQAALAQRAAQVGLGHPHVLVRRRSCELLTRHPQAGQAAWLGPLIRDEAPSVQLAAAEALGASGDPAAATALARLLTNPSRPLRLATATALARLGDARGHDELSRLAYDLDGDVRREAAAVMGRLGQDRFVPTLIALLDDRQLDVRRAALASLEAIAGDQVRIEQGSDGVADRRQQILAWKQWWAEQPRDSRAN
jgi:HEAT repeat protein